VGVAAEYSKRMFLDAHDYIAEDSIDPISVRVRTLNASSEGRCWVSKSLRVNTPCGRYR